MNIRDIECGDGIIVVIDNFENVLTINGRGSSNPSLAEFEVDTLEELRLFVSKNGFENHLELEDNYYNIFIVYKIGYSQNVYDDYLSTSYKQIGYINLQTLRSKIRDKKIETFL